MPPRSEVMCEEPLNNRDLCVRFPIANNPTIKLTKGGTYEKGTYYKITLCYPFSKDKSRQIELASYRKPEGKPLEKVFHPDIYIGGEICHDLFRHLYPNFFGDECPADIINTFVNTSNWNN